MTAWLNALFSTGKTYVLHLYLSKGESLTQCGMLACDSVGLAVEWQETIRLVPWAAIENVEVEICE